uniref:Amine oxidase domain-containing protein n=1 Tax=Tetradesmus obliquus TaxID=3088 RepID=A0A383VUL2_TETOB|eukprot:jgi/Sobl393_1/8605/SZX68891.1
MRLRQKGYRDITVVERSAGPGGKAVTLEVENNEGVKTAPLYLGPILGTWGGYITVTKLLQQYNVPISNVTYNSNSGPQWKPGESVAVASNFVNHQTGTALPLATLQLDPTAIFAAATKYAMLYTQQVKPYLVPGYTKGLPAELRQSYGAWIRANGLDALLPALYVMITAYGYGSLEVTPAFYAMTFVDPVIINVALGLGGSYLADFQQLWTSVAADLSSSGVKFVYNADISRVRQSSSASKKSTIRYTTPAAPGKHSSHPKVARCDRIIAAFPHFKKNLAAFDLDAKERAVFDLVRQVQYYSGVINMPNSTKGRFVRLLKLTGNAAVPFSLAEPPGDGYPSVHVVWPFTPVAQFWTWVAGQTELPMETIAANALATMSKYNRPVGSAVTDAVPLTKADLKRLDKWDYFALFDMSTLTETIFSQLEALQGRRGTFYTSSLRSFESQEAVVNSAYDIVDRYF